MLKYTIIKLNLPISYKYVFYQTHRCIYSVMTKNILNTKSGNLEMSQCLQCTSRNKTYCDKGRINNMKFFSNSLLIVWISHENKICFNHQLPPPPPQQKKNWCHITPLPPSPWWSPTYRGISPPPEGGRHGCNESSTCTSCLKATIISYFFLIKAVVAEVVLINLTTYIMSSISYYHTLP